jgi:hypothetical protein
VRAPLAAGAGASPSSLSGVETGIKKYSIAENIIARTFVFVRY